MACSSFDLLSACCTLFGAMPHKSVASDKKRRSRKLGESFASQEHHIKGGKTP
jgi:hypothetical protein